ncbi:hypothetical protein Bbelb_093800 [Branchiostoma belcheri]|nr:hypothetical protein Bbelb_093800 [Branchiostoma belcheri]
MAANADIQRYFTQTAFSHNRMYKTKKKQVKGCHDLRCLLEAQSRGLVVAAVVKLPGDSLPEGVYTVLLSCRPDVEPPDSSKRKQPDVNTGMETWEMVRCTNCDCNNQPRAGCKRNGILFKFDPIVKTVYDPAVWSDDDLASFCVRAYREATGMGRFDEKGTYWEGKVTEDRKEYWMGGYMKDSKIENFFFIHPDYLYLKVA